jgi:hypothetical protein
MLGWGVMRPLTEHWSGLNERTAPIHPVLECTARTGVPFFPRLEERTLWVSSMGGPLAGLAKRANRRGERIVAVRMG